MPTGSTGDDPDGELPPPGTRWGTGAGSVLPFLARSLQARPSSGQDETKTREDPPRPAREHPGASAP